MRVMAETAKVQEVTQLVTSVAGARAVLPILGSVLVRAEGDMLRLTTTNQELWLEGWREGVQVEKPGAVAVDKQAWKQLIAQVLDETMSLVLDGEKRLKVRFGRAEYRLGVMKAEDFPLMEQEPDWRELGETPGKELAEAIQDVLFAAATGALSSFAGVHFRKDTAEEPLEVVATDTVRLSLVRVPVENLAPLKITIGRASMTALLPVLRQTAKVLWLKGQNNWLCLMGERWRAVITPYMEKYPDYRTIIPQEPDPMIKVKGSELKVALRRMVALERGSKSPPRVIWRLRETNERDAELVLWEAETAEEKAVERVGMEWLTTPQTLDVCFNAVFLWQLVSRVSGDVTVGFAGQPDKPVLFLPEDEREWLYIVMPMILPGVTA